MAAKYPDLGSAAGKAKQARQTYEFIKPAAIDSGEVAHLPVIIVGGGPVGLAAAIDLAGHGIQSLILERSNTVSDGSRAICWAKRTLDICDRLGTGERMLDKGVTWDVGKVFVGADRDPVYTFDLLPDKEQKMPGFINLQQFYTEEYFVAEIEAMDRAEIRWQNEVIAIDNEPDKVTLTVKTPEGEYHVSCDYLIAADGHRSPSRALLGLGFEGRIFEDNFLIADVRMKADFPAERRFWFDPPFNPGQTSLMHKQPDDVWRLDFQLGWDIDRTEAMQPENVDKKVRAFIGPDVEFDYEWVSIYTFSCLKMKNFVHNRVIFAGDAAHLVSPFGARGANGGLQDADNLAWKIAYVLQGLAPPELLNTYDDERICAANENILNSSRSTDFMTPKTKVSRFFRDACLELSRELPFARALVNSGRLSVPCVLDQSPLNTSDTDDFSPKQRPGAACMDAPVQLDGKDSWLLEQLGWTFKGLYFAAEDEDFRGAEALAQGSLPVEVIVVRTRGSAGLVDQQGLVAKHYDARPGTFYLIRPDQHVAGRWRQFDAQQVQQALRKATAQA
ncbi:MAG: FAD-dependent oxidoreductase [Gammaproteobacteria bacterium]|uniref:FAD-dependent oxidoreductase n=1 Tax=Pseudomaricurvus alcaniphilus TaxID=1166482 RepID=UPI0014077C84|nr:FAD-dependent oxidoreductase [Pseudomaricurvus alcaniphilus]MBR9908975.1 FAD-dependent oxidoreductase [Gammaproteobacteria bacterium]NHN38028.1 FAD-dependent oxidoreductase [Pseudomaricurvus alcaniphilus]